MSFCGELAETIDVGNYYVYYFLPNIALTKVQTDTRENAKVSYLIYGSRHLNPKGLDINYYFFINPYSMRLAGILILNLKLDRFLKNLKNKKNLNHCLLNLNVQFVKQLSSSHTPFSISFYFFVNYIE